MNLWARKSQQLAKTGSVFDFDALREKHGLVRRENVRDAVCEAFAERIKRHKANMRTDPPRVPQYPRVNGKMVFALNGLNNQEVSHDSGVN